MDEDDDEGEDDDDNDGADDDVAEDDQLLFLLLDYSVCVVLARRDVEDCDVWALEEATKHVHGSGSEVFQDPWFWV